MGRDDLVRPEHCQFEGTPSCPDKGVCSQGTFRTWKLVLVSAVNREMVVIEDLVEGGS